MTQTFAFGDNELGSCKCPAVAAGMDPLSDDGLLRVAETYDEIVRDRVGTIEGQIDEDEAKDAWERAVQLCHAGDGNRVGDTTGQLAVERGIEVARKLGWDDVSRED